MFKVVEDDINGGVQPFTPEEVGTVIGATAGGAVVGLATGGPGGAAVGALGGYTVTGAGIVGGHIAKASAESAAKSGSDCSGYAVKPDMPSLF